MPGSSRAALATTGSNLFQSAWTAAPQRAAGKHRVTPHGAAEYTFWRGSTLRASEHSFTRTRETNTMAAKRKWVYFFGGGKAEGKVTDKMLLGGKGAGLAEMTRIGLPVPGGFTITTEACAEATRLGKWPAGLEKEVREHLTKLERVTKKKFGDRKKPLLVSVRSGAAVSMPGMMETILNLGLNDTTVEALADLAESRRFAFDAYRRLIMMYGSTAKGVSRELFDDCFDEVKNTQARMRLGKAPNEKVLDTELTAEELEKIVEEFKAIYLQHTGEAFPQDPMQQLKGSIDAVFGSWMAEKAVTYRRVERITGLNGTAVNVCQMVFGNMGDDSGTGVCFTRDPSTGENVYYGDCLINAQGEDVVAGVRTPMKLDELQALMPEAYDQLEAVRIMLECHYTDMQDLEFTIEKDVLYMLQCRTGKRSAAATFKIAHDHATEGVVPKAVASRLAKKKYLPAKYATAAAKPVISKDEAIQRIKPEDIERLFFPVLDPDVPASELEQRKLTEANGAVPGAACGEIAFSAEVAEARAEEGRKVILVRKETSPEDVGGMYAAVGILTATGGKTSHAAVVARGWGKCCIVGCDALNIDYKTKRMTVNDVVLHEGTFITLDGTTGAVYEGQINLSRPSAPAEYDTMMQWCDQRRRLLVRTNADTPEDSKRAVSMGAQGIGLCRTEHMFFDPSQPQRIRAMREMILASDEAGRRRALDKLLEFQRADFEGIFTAMDGKPVTVRLLDPPLHEFLPQDEKAQNDVVSDLNEAIDQQLAEVEAWDHDLREELEAQRVDLAGVRKRVEDLHESNPMLGHRGCRLCVTFPEILEMQVRAIIEAAVNCTKQGVKVLPEIMIPLTIDAKELGILADKTREVADGILKASGTKLNYLVGTMIETPRAALLAGQLAEVADFFSFGTNDLTQTVMALSRDDCGAFLNDYVDQAKAGILPHHPFQSLDVDGVGMLVAWAVSEAREVKPKIKLGICGEHGGDPDSIRFFDDIGLDYVSCSPFRVPVARLAAAQSVIEGAAAKKSPRKSAGKKTAKTSAKKAGKTGSTKKTGKATSAKKKGKAASAKKTSKAASTKKAAKATSTKKAGKKKVAKKATGAKKTAKKKAKRR
jgi:pyruvate,orthophosphate dikinase